MDDPVITVSSRPAKPSRVTALERDDSRGEPSDTLRVRLRSSFALCLLPACLAACVRDTAVGNAPSAAPSSAAAPGDAAPSAVAASPADAAATGAVIAAPRTPVPAGPQKWRSVPKELNGFYAVVDGLCSQLAADKVGDDVVVHYGGAGSIEARYRTGAASFVALRDAGLESIGDPSIAAPTGIAGRSIDDFWIADSTGTRSSEGAVLHRYQGGTWKTYGKDQTNLHAWLDGGIIGSLGFAAANGELWVEGSSTKPPEALYRDMPYPSLSAFPTGDVLVVGRREWTQDERAPLLARHWSPATKATEHPLEALLPVTGDGERFATLHEVSPEEVYVFRNDRVARWDGKAFHALAKTIGGGSALVVRRVASDDLWVLTGDRHSTDEPAKTVLQRVTKDAAAVIPTPEPVVDMDGVDRGAAWIVGRSGKLYRREGEGWGRVPLPPPAFSSGTALKAKRILVVAPGDALLTAMYWEKAPGWTEPELHTALFRTRPVKETLRCNEPDPENNNYAVGRGYQSWPPMADEACATPFVVLARRSKARATEDDWPRIRAAVKGHAELGEVDLVELVSGDRTFVGAKAKDLDAAKRLLKLVAAKDRLRPEIVCGDPDPRRTLHVDLATGAATPK